MKRFAEIGTARRWFNRILLLLLLATGAFWIKESYFPPTLSDQQAMEMMIQLRLAQLEWGENSPATRTMRNQITAENSSSSQALLRWMEQFKSRPHQWDSLQTVMVSTIDSLRRTVSNRPITQLRPAVTKERPAAPPKRRER